MRKELRAWTPEELERSAEKFRNPAPGSRMEAAKEYGVDWTLLISHLSLTPAERVKRMLAASGVAAGVRGAARLGRR